MDALPGSRSAGCPGALDHIGTACSHIQQHIHQMVCEQIHFVDIQYAAIGLALPDLHAVTGNAEHAAGARLQRHLAQIVSTTTSEIWALDANQPHLDFTCLAPRVEDHEYDVDHGQRNGEWTWFIRSNRDGINYALYQAPDLGQAPEEADWQLLIPHSDTVLLDGLTALDPGIPVLSEEDANIPQSIRAGWTRWCNENAKTKPRL